MKTGKATIMARHVDVLHGTKSGVRHGRLEVQPVDRRRRVLIVAHRVGLVEVESWRLRAYADICDGSGSRRWRWGDVVWSRVDVGSRMKLRRGEELLLKGLRRWRDETGRQLMSETLSRVGTVMPLQLVGA